MRKFQTNALTVHTNMGHTWQNSQLPQFQKGMYRGADKSLARPGRKQATATEDFEFHVSYS